MKRCENCLSLFFEYPANDAGRRRLDPAKEYRPAAFGGLCLPCAKRLRAVYLIDRGWSIPCGPAPNPEKGA